MYSLGLGSSGLSSVINIQHSPPWTPGYCRKYSTKKCRFRTNGAELWHSDSQKFNNLSLVIIEKYLSWRSQRARARATSANWETLVRWKYWWWKVTEHTNTVWQSDSLSRLAGIDSQSHGVLLTLQSCAKCPKCPHYGIQWSVWLRWWAMCFIPVMWG